MTNTPQSASIHWVLLCLVHAHGLGCHLLLGNAHCNRYCRVEVCVRDLQGGQSSNLPTPLSLPTPWGGAVRDCMQASCGLGWQVCCRRTLALSQKLSWNPVANGPCLKMRGQIWCTLENTLVGAGGVSKKHPAAKSFTLPWFWRSSLRFVGLFFCYQVKPFQHTVSKPFFGILSLSDSVTGITSTGAIWSCGNMRINTWPPPNSNGNSYFLESCPGQNCSHCSFSRTFTPLVRKSGFLNKELSFWPRLRN